MGEYAIRKSDGASIKVGTCNSMYYSRWSQRNDFRGFTLGNEMGNLLWRLPIPDEDGIQVGDFDYGVWATSPYTALDESMAEILVNSDGEPTLKPGIAQAKIDRLGMLLNVPCEHGLRLPLNTGDIKTFLNGCSFPIRLCAVKNDTSYNRMSIIVGCTACQCKWSFDFSEVQKYIKSSVMKLRLLRLCEDYWRDHHEKGSRSFYKATSKCGDGRQKVSMGFDPDKRCWRTSLITLEPFPNIILAEGPFPKCSKAYIDEIEKEQGYVYA